jgi:indole-3-glycerol phosphate synthase
LDNILETKRKELEALRGSCTLEDLSKRAADARPVRNFYQAVTRDGRRPVRLIAEIKKASPSAGIIREDFDPAALARQYEQAGADALSVLTDETYFRGSLDYLRTVSETVSLPILRKDFIIDPMQVYQARAVGADAVLLIAAALPTGMLSDLMILAAELKMTVLLEVHEADDLLRVRSMVGFPHRTYSLLGINNRDLKTFAVDIDTTLRLAELAGEGVPVVSESGIRTSDDVRKLADGGISAILVGETFMRQPDIGQAVNNLLGPKEK